MPKPQQVLAEMIRVARPGGCVFMSRRRGWERKVMPGKSWPKQEFRAMLISLGLRNVQVRSWQKDYDLTWGKKPAAPSWTCGRPAQQSRGATWIEELLCCPVCGRQALKRDAASLFCPTCSSRYSIAADGIVELAGTRQPTQWWRYRATGISQIE